MCDECKTKEAIRFYCLGAKRCLECAEIFDTKNRNERRRKENEVHKCSECNELFTGIYDCPHCCSHEFDPDEGYHCLGCGTDGSEEVMSDAYDRAKDYYKYGDE